MSSSNVIIKGRSIFLRCHNEWYVYETDSAPIGAGAMGIVYIGRSYSTGEKVAIKRVAPKYQDVLSIRQRAYIEGSLRFGHQNLIRMIGCCEYDDVHHIGPIWLISHLVSGISLEDHVKNLKNTNRPITKIIETMYPVLDALDYLHGGHILHLDIKPSNIMCENGYNIRLMDLGIASVGNVNLKQETGLIGTAAYAAPEQFSDDGLNVYFRINATTDIYQVGVTLYELLTGLNPYEAHSIQASKLLHETLSLPENEDVPDSVLSVLRKTTAPLQSERYQTAHQLKYALEKSLMQYESTNNKKWWKFWMLVSLPVLLQTII